MWPKTHSVLECDIYGLYTGCLNAFLQDHSGTYREVTEVQAGLQKVV